MKHISERIKYILMGVLFVSVLGAFAHSFYDWSGKNPLIGLFFPRNESTWEHMKLVFVPMLIYSICMRQKMKKKYSAYTFIALCGTFVGTWIMPALCFSYRGVLGYGLMWADIATFFVAVLLAFILENHMLYRIGHKECPNVTTIAILLVGLQLLAFVWFSYRPLSIGIFQTLPQ